MAFLSDFSEADRWIREQLDRGDSPAPIPERLAILQEVNTLVCSRLAPYGEFLENHDEIRSWAGAFELELKEAHAILLSEEDTSRAWTAAKQKVAGLIRNSAGFLAPLLEERAARISSSAGHAFIVATLFTLLALAPAPLLAQGISATGIIILVVWVAHILRVYSGLAFLDRDPSFIRRMKQFGNRWLIVTEYSLKVLILVLLSVLASSIGRMNQPLIFVLTILHATAMVAHHTVLRKIWHKRTLTTSTFPLLLGDYAFLVILFFYGLSLLPVDFFLDPSYDYSGIFRGTALVFAAIYICWFLLKEFNLFYKEGFHQVTGEVRAYIADGP